MPVRVWNIFATEAWAMATCKVAVPHKLQLFCINSPPVLHKFHLFCCINPPPPVLCSSVLLVAAAGRNQPWKVCAGERIWEGFVQAARLPCPPAEVSFQRTPTSAPQPCNPTQPSAMSLLNQLNSRKFASVWQERAGRPTSRIHVSLLSLSLLLSGLEFSNIQYSAQCRLLV